MPLNYFNYFTEVEEHFSKRRGKHLTISPLDFTLIEVWKDSGIPLNVAIRGIDRAFDHYDARPIKPRLVNSLFYCHQEVLVAFEEHKQAYVGANPDERASAEATQNEAAHSPAAERDKLTGWLTAQISELDKAEARARLENRSASLEAIGRVRTRLHDLWNELANPQLQSIPYESLERDLTLLDKLLRDAAQGEVPDELRSTWHAEGTRELKTYKRNLPKETYERILDNYISKKIHQHFGFPPLSLFYL